MHNRHIALVTASMLALHSARWFVGVILAAVIVLGGLLLLASSDTQAVSVSGPTPSYIIDTGPGESTFGGESPALYAEGDTTCSPQPSCADDFQFLGGQFTLLGDAVLDSVEGWMGVNLGGDVEVHIRSDAAGIPGDSLYAQTYATESTGGADVWQAFPNFNVELPAGTFWLTFEPVADGGGLLGDRPFFGGMPKGAPNGLANYAFFNNNNGNWRNLGKDFPGDLGVRISGTGPAVIPKTGGAITNVIYASAEFHPARDDFDATVNDPTDTDAFSFRFNTHTGHAVARAQWAPGLDVGVFASRNAAAHGVAFRAYQYTGTDAIEVTINVELAGRFKDAPFSLPSGPLHMFAEIIAVDSEVFDQILPDDPELLEDFFFDIPNKHTDLVEPFDLFEKRPALLFGSGKLAGESVSLSPLPFGERSQSLSPSFTVNPGQRFTVLFDIAAMSFESCEPGNPPACGAGSVRFLNSLSSAPTFFTDSSGDPIGLIVPIGGALDVPPPTTLTLVNTVVNDDGGTAGVGDFMLRIDGIPVPSGLAIPVSAGAHLASEDDPSPGYAASVWGGDCAADGTLTLSLGDEAVCTITNDDIALTPTPTGPPTAGKSVAWGDANCSGSAGPVDSLLTMRHDAGLPANTGDCPALGTTVDVAFASLHVWGDVDCSGEITPVDSLKLLRFDAGLGVTQADGCPGMGTSVTIVEG